MCTTSYTTPNGHYQTQNSLCNDDLELVHRSAGHAGHVRCVGFFPGIEFAGIADVRRGTSRTRRRPGSSGSPPASRPAEKEGRVEELEGVGVNATYRF